LNHTQKFATGWIRVYGKIQKLPNLLFRGRGIRVIHGPRGKGEKRRASYLKKGASPVKPECERRRVRKWREVRIHKY